MAKQPDSDGKLPDPAVWAENWTRIAERSQKLLSEFASHQQNETTPANPDPLNLNGAFMAMTANLMADPERLVEEPVRFWQDYAPPWAHAAHRDRTNGGGGKSVEGRGDHGGR